MRACVLTRSRNGSTVGRSLGRPVPSNYLCHNVTLTHSLTHSSSFHFDSSSTSLEVSRQVWASGAIHRSGGRACQLQLQFRSSWELSPGASRVRLGRSRTRVQWSSDLQRRTCKFGDVESRLPRSNFNFTLKLRVRPSEVQVTCGKRTTRIREQVGWGNVSWVTNVQCRLGVPKSSEPGSRGGRRQGSQVTHGI